jgi:transposase
MRVRPIYTDEFKADAVALMLRSERSPPQVARDLGVCITSLRNWYNAQSMANKKPPRGLRAVVPSVPPTSPEDEVRQLKRELALAEKRIGELEQDREILKKAAAFFAKESE